MNILRWNLSFLDRTFQLHIILTLSQRVREKKRVREWVTELYINELKFFRIGQYARSTLLFDCSFHTSNPWHVPHLAKNRTPRGIDYYTTVSIYPAVPFTLAYRSPTTLPTPFIGTTTSFFSLFFFLLSFLLSRVSTYAPSANHLSPSSKEGGDYKTSAMLAEL